MKKNVTGIKMNYEGADSFTHKYEFEKMPRSGNGKMGKWGNMQMGNDSVTNDQTIICLERNFNEPAAIINNQ